MKFLKKPVAFPIFQEASQLTNDPFWVHKLENAARGKFPKKFSYNNGVLCFRHRNKKLIRKHIPDDPKGCYEAFTSFLGNEAGIVSDIDNERNIYRNELNAQIQNNTVSKWTKTKKKTNENLIERFVYRQKNLLNLTQKQTNDLKSKIQLGLRIGVIDSEKVRLSAGEIEYIEGLYYSSGEFFLDPERVKRQMDICISKISNNSVTEADTITFPNHVENDFLSYMRYYADSVKGIPEASKANSIQSVQHVQGRGPGFNFVLVE